MSLWVAVLAGAGCGVSAAITYALMGLALTRRLGPTPPGEPRVEPPTMQQAAPRFYNGVPTT